MRIEGNVVNVDGETALVATNRESGCEACSADDGCACDDVFFVTARNPIGAAKGERVELRIGTGRMWLTVFSVFCLPLLLGGGGYAAGAALAEVAGGVLGALAGVAVAVGLIVWLERRAARSGQYVIARRL